MDARRQDLTNSIGLLILRLGIGGYLVTHGWDKVQMVTAGNFEQMGDPIGLGPTLSLILIMLAEFVCALFVMVGFATRFAAAPVVFGMAVAAFGAHAGDPWTMGEGYRLFMEGEAESWASKEPAMLFLFAFLALIFTGAGKLSLDGVIWSRLRLRKHDD